MDAPDPVLAYLCHLSHLHRIPVGDRSVNNFIDEIPQRCPDIRRYLSETHSVSYHCIYVCSSPSAYWIKLSLEITHMQIFLSNILQLLNIWNEFQPKPKLWKDSLCTI